MPALPTSIDTSYWGDVLEVNAELIRRHHEDDNLLRRWVDSIEPRAREVLIESLGIDADLGVKQQRNALLQHREQLLPFALAESATAFKRQYSILEVAKAKLTPEEIERCFISGTKYDRGALAWLLYRKDPKNLELVAHLDRVHRNGFAPMVLSDSSGGGDPALVRAFLKREMIQTILNEYEARERTLRQSHCAAVLDDGGNYRVFIKRDHRSAFVAHGEKNTFGFEPEWIVLEFEPDLRRVHVCSISPDTPLKLANEITSKFFEREVTYVNESVVTTEETVRAFLKSLIDEPETLPLVEFVSKNCGLEDAPQLRLNVPDNRSLGPALRQFGLAFGDLFADLDDIDSIKVVAFKKRVKVTVEPVKDVKGGYEVRYGDQPLNGKERREFEQLIKARHGISILSTEKRYAK